jgi:hypothetical protein
VPRDMDIADVAARSTARVERKLTGREPSPAQ